MRVCERMDTQSRSVYSECSIVNKPARVLVTAGGEEEGGTGSPWPLPGLPLYSTQQAPVEWWAPPTNGPGFSLKITPCRRSTNLFMKMVRCFIMYWWRDVLGRARGAFGGPDYG